MSEKTAGFNSANIPNFETDLGRYGEAVETILGQLDTGTPPAEIPGYINSGSVKHVFRITGQDGRVAAAKILLQREEADPDERPLFARTMDEAAPLIRGRGRDNLEQLLTVSPRQGVLITDIKPGTLVAEISSRSLLFRIKPRHIRQLAITLQDMRSLGLHHHNAGGILFDEKSGFNFVDYVYADSSSYLSSGFNENAELFLKFALSDHNKMEKVRDWHFENGEGRMPNPIEVTTGMRALHRSILMKLARRLDATFSNDVDP